MAIKFSHKLIPYFLFVTVTLGLPSQVKGQYSYSIANGNVTITGWVGNPTTITLPATISGYPVSAIRDQAFYGCSSLISISIPYSVQSIGARALANCSHLTSISVDGSNPFFSSINGVLFNKSGNQLLQYPGGLSGSYTIPDGVTSIQIMAFGWCPSITGVIMPGSLISLGDQAFYGCAGLTNATLPDNLVNIGIGVFYGCNNLIAIAVADANTNFSSLSGVLFNKTKTQLIAYPNGLSGSYTVPGGVTNIAADAFYSCPVTRVTIPSSVTSVGNYTFGICSGLTNVFFQGNAPLTNSTIFYGDTLTFYYLPDTTGWGTFISALSLAHLTPVLWNAHMETADGGFGMQAGQFGFNITGSSGLTVVVEACTNLVNPDWQPVQTNTLSDGSTYFSDPQWTNFPNRFYRLRSQ